MEDNGLLPRDLAPIERELLLWVLPENRPGYGLYRNLIQTWKVTAQGRRGEGNYIMAPPGTIADNDSPLPQVFAYGVAETTKGEVAVTVRERLGDQVEYEIVYPRGERVSLGFEEIRRWTFSTWNSSQPCPMCSTRVREVHMKSRLGRNLVLAICVVDRRLWVYDGATGVNHPIPVTNIYNELAMQSKMKDPRVAFDSWRLFSDLPSFSDADLTKAFASYNNIRTKVPLEDGILIEERSKRSLLKRLFSKA